MKQIISPEKTIEHLTPESWAKANLYLIQKALAEFAHEMIINPQLIYEKDGWGYYQLPAQHTEAEIIYTFKAQKRILDHWSIDVHSIRKTHNGKEVPLDLIHLIVDFKEELEFSKEILPVYIEELISTLYARAQVMNRENNSCILADADYQTIEGSTTGHPTFIANNGRIGFDADDYYKYAPESQNELRLLWIAVKKGRCNFSTVESLSYDELMNQELSPETLIKFSQKLKDLDLNTEEFYYMPIHPWQWYNKMNPTFSSEIALQNIVLLGEAEDLYRAQQSIRTFFNTSNPDKFYVKTAMSVLNMGFMRGLSPYYMKATPAINQWVDDLVKSDVYLQEKGFIILKEIAAIGYRSEYYEKALQNNNTPYTKMLAALWRESPMPFVNENQRLMTMAALLHLDNNGYSLAAELIEKSGLTAEEWVSKYLDLYLMPLIHSFYEYDLVYMPHGENLILIIENYTPVKIIMKDIAEEIAILNGDIKLPGETSRIGIKVPDDFKLTYIFTDVFDCFLRYLSALLHDQADFRDEDFWRLVADKIIAYQEERPHLKEKFEKYDIFEPQFKRCCLNRLQIKNNKQMVNLEDPINSLQFVGMLDNPIHIYKRELA
ncbi:TPA: IucA/IucC family siderophore biosynthesis protein [Elizabethkingia anophelis]|uniref:IucA/IucC family protein n=1 Tax=Elizabethkingia anophelis TaxID=1117645 RepID=UPI0004060E09|nr:IucA/IucC family siderophore biosynthesis protein [Elizabethkingia anophelis]MDC8025099.1 IucA/IucC family siderophore biosynthesis protein [Elizabethkingia anophelis]MDV3490276.1 IucA/IucC family siderophore biosynthesis protein [Elizabethkingia anophelis]MDV4128712.1 IucA/IucC family siderophore biosynthesis protein [Elizabethkingia anophelis]MDV4134772.1 IucA/IucC family siderophore biosynthesis protein [Elizabethkingia anophelis]OPC62803.1 IucA/IucC family protein [Elizabethkingia anoph